MPDDVLTSLQNPSVKRIVRLRNRRDRDREGVFIVEGQREVQRALAAGIRFAEVYTCSSYPGSDCELPIQGMQVSPAVMAKISYRDSPTGVLAVCYTPLHRLSDLEVKGSSLFLIPVGSEKPGNLGAMARTAVAFGCSALIAAEPNVDLFNPNAIRNSTGAIFALPVVSADAHSVRKWMSDNNIRQVAAAVDGAVECWSAPLKDGPIALIIGPEHAGLDAAWQSAADVRIHIPQVFSTVDSLNAAASAAVLLYEVARQRTTP